MRFKIFILLLILPIYLYIFMQTDPLQYIKDIQRLSWKDLGYSSNMTRVLSGEKLDISNGNSSFDYIDDGGLNSGLIENLNWSKGRGGELILGGSGNTSGLLKVLDALGIDRIILDKDGITVNDGKITIKDSSNTTILDSIGLVSSENFANNSYTATNLINTTSATPVDITGSSLTFTLARTTNVLIALSALTDYFPGSSGDGTQTGGSVYLNIDTTNTQELRSLFYPYTGTDHEVQNTISFTTIVSLDAGEHTIKLQWETNNAGEQFSLTNRSLIYVILGK